MMDQRDFSLDILAIHLPCKVRTGLEQGLLYMEYTGDIWESMEPTPVTACPSFLSVTCTS